MTREGKTTFSVEAIGRVLQLVKKNTGDRRHRGEENRNYTTGGCAIDRDRENEQSMFTDKAYVGRGKGKPERSNEPMGVE